MAMLTSSVASTVPVATSIHGRVGLDRVTRRVAPRPRGRAVRLRAAPAPTDTSVKFVDFDTSGCGPFPLLDPTRGYSHVSPGVCDTCADSAEARRAWVALLLGQLPSHRLISRRRLPTRLRRQVPRVGG